MLLNLIICKRGYILLLYFLAQFSNVSNWNNNLNNNILFFLPLSSNKREIHENWIKGEGT